MACVLTTAFALDCKDSVGGIKAVYLVESSAKGTITKSTSGTVTAWTLSGGKNFFKYELRKATSQFTTTVQANQANGTTFYETDLTIQLNKLEVYKRNEIKLLAQNTLLIIALDRNGTYWLLGEGNGCDLTTGAGATGTAMGDFNGWNLTFKAVEEDMPLIVASGVATSLGL